MRYSIKWLQLSMSLRYNSSQYLPLFVVTKGRIGKFVMSWANDKIPIKYIAPPIDVEIYLMIILPDGWFINCLHGFVVICVFVVTLSPICSGLRHLHWDNHKIAQCQWGNPVRRRNSTCTKAQPKMTKRKLHAWSTGHGLYQLGLNAKLTRLALFGFH